MSVEHRHVWKFPAVRVGEFVIVGDKAMCHCGAWKPAKLPRRMSIEGYRS